MTHNTTPRWKLIAGCVLTLCVPLAALAAPGWMGVSIGDITSEKVSELKLKEERGVEVLSVASDSPAEKAGLKARDVILDFNGQRVDGMEQFSRLVRETPAGRTVRLLISRAGATETLQVTLGPSKSNVFAVAGPREFEFRMPKIEIPEIRIDPEMRAMIVSSRLGVETQPLTKQLREYFGVTDSGGVLVASVESGSVADKAGIKAGDVITRIDKQKIDSARDLRSALRDKSAKSVPVTLVRNKREMTVTVALESERGGYRERVIEKMESKGARV